jgi:hypothetical protein
MRLGAHIQQWDAELSNVKAVHLCACKDVLVSLKARTMRATKVAAYTQRNVVASGCVLQP